MGTFNRLQRIIKANLNNSLNNPEKSLDKYIKEMEATIIQLRKSIIQISAARKRNEERYNYNILEIARWKEKAELALSMSDEDSAQEALLRKQYFTDNAAELKFQMNLDNSSDIIIDLQQKLAVLEMKVIEYKRFRVSQYGQKIVQSQENIDTNSSMSAFEKIEGKSAAERMEDLVMRLEKEAASASELGGTGIEKQFAALEAESGVDDGLRKLKAQLSGTCHSVSESSLIEKNSAIDAELEELRKQLDT